MASLDKIVCCYAIGSGSDASRRYVQYVTPAQGWAGFVTDHITPMLNRGFSRFLLWMPHGRESAIRKQLAGKTWRPTLLRFDAWRVAQQNAANIWFTNGFAEAFAPLTAAGVEIIAYVGMLHGAPEFDILPVGQAKWEACMSIAPLLDARCSIAFDTAILSYPGHYVYDLTQFLKSVGYKYYIEPTPLVDGQHWFNSSCVVSDEQWSLVINPDHQTTLAAPSKLTGEIIRGWFGERPANFTTVNAWYQATVPTALAAGHTCCLPLSTYFKFGGTVAGLLVG